MQMNYQLTGEQELFSQPLSFCSSVFLSDLIDFLALLGILYRVAGGF